MNPNQTNTNIEIEQASTPKLGLGELASTTEESKEEQYFEGSTHFYTVYAEDYNIWFLGLLVIIIQYVLYAIIIKEGSGNIKDDQVAVNVTWSDCVDSKPYNVDAMVCSADEPEFGYMVLAMILAAIFLQYDYMASYNVIFYSHKKWERFAGLLVFIEAALATTACGMFAYGGLMDGSGYDAIMNCIGVLFIHDVDEKVYESVGIIKPSNKKFSCCGHKIGKFLRKSMVSWCTIIFLLFISLFVTAIFYMY